MPSRRPTLAALAAVLALALACAPPRRPPPDLSLDPAALLTQVETAGAAITRVQGEARLRVDAPGARGSMPAYVAAERPDRLHVEALDFFGNPAATLIAAGGRLGIYDAKAKTFYMGAATGPNVARLFPLPLSPERLVAILCGTPVLEGGGDAAEPGNGDVELTLREGPRTATLRVGPRAAIVRAAFRGGAPALPDHDVVYGEFLELDRARFPGQVTITSPDPAVRVELAWKAPEVAGKPLAASLFKLDPPSGAKVVDLDATTELPTVPLPLVPPAP
jgi:hypothetical protein